MPRFYLRQLRADASAPDTNGASPAHYAGVVLERSAAWSPDSEAVAVNAILTEDVAAAIDAAEHILSGVTEEVDSAEETDGTDSHGRRRRRRRRGGRGRHDSATAAAEEHGVLPGEPGLPSAIVEHSEDFVPDVPPSSHLAEMVQSGSLKLPEPRGRRRRTGQRDSELGVNGAADTADLAARLPEPVNRGPRDRMSVLEEALVRQNTLIDFLLQSQRRQEKYIERIAQLMERGGLGGGGGTSVASERVAVFVDVPNIVYAADRLNIEIDWGKVLNYLTRDRQLVRATAYAPVSDDPRHRIEQQKFVEPFYKLPYRILTKPLKRFGNGEIKANFDVELAIDVIAMADRLDVVSLISGDGDFRRMVELVQSKGVRVEVMAFGSSTAGELRMVCDRYIDLQNVWQELSVNR